MLIKSNLSPSGIEISSRLLRVHVHLKFSVLDTIAHLCGISRSIVLTVRYLWCMETVTTCIAARPMTSQELLEAMAILFVKYIIYYRVNWRVQKVEENICCPEKNARHFDVGPKEVYEAFDVIGNPNGINTITTLTSMLETFRFVSLAAGWFPTPSDDCLCVDIETRLYLHTSQFVRWRTAWTGREYYPRYL